MSSDPPAGRGSTGGGPVDGARARRPSREERRAARAAVDDPEVVLAAAARFLEARGRSVVETRRHLVGAGYAAALVEGALARLTELGILDDAAFARAWVASRDRAHPRGERALRSELALKGIDRGLIDEVLAERAAGVAVRPLEAAVPPLGAAIDDERDHGSADESAATRLLERRRSTLERVDDPRVRRQRAYALLARGGFDPDTAARVALRFVRGEEE